MLTKTFQIAYVGKSKKYITDNNKYFFYKEEILSEIKRINSSKVMILGELLFPEDMPSVTEKVYIPRVCLRVEHLFIDKLFLYAGVTFLDTPRGKMVQEYLNSYNTISGFEKNIFASMRSLSNIVDDKYAKNIQILGIDVRVL